MLWEVASRYLAVNHWYRSGSRAVCSLAPSSLACTQLSIHPVSSVIALDDDYLANVDLVLLDIKSGIPDIVSPGHRGEARPPTLEFAERLRAMGKPVWVRFVLVPGLTDDTDNVSAIARFLGPMENVEWVEVLPFHQMGAFKWKSLGLENRLSDVPTPTDAQVMAVLDIFRGAGCRARS